MPRPRTDKEPSSFTTLRLPKSIKDSIDAVAASEYISTNALILALIRKHLKELEESNPG